MASPLVIVHGGQSGVDRGAHEAAIEHGWLIDGYMPYNERDELGAIPPDVAQYLRRHPSTSYAARTEANVRSSDAVLIIVRHAANPRETPGTAKTIDLAEARQLRGMIVDPMTHAAQIARWIWNANLMHGTLPLPFDGQVFEPVPTRLLVAGPRESKWPGARAETVALLRRVATHLGEISRETRASSRDRIP
jgi:Circularly permutated YpsA SLOG family